MNADEIKAEINNVRHYSVESLRALAGIASEIRGVKDADARNELTQLFELVHARKVAVWSRIPKRFPEAMSDNGRTMTTDAFLSVAYLCQLPEETCQELYAAHYDHLNEPNVLPLIRNEVNAAKPQRAPRNGHAQKCKWTPDSEDSGIYSTSCGEAFVIEAGTPTENNFKFCTYCGGALIDAAIRKAGEAAK